jgi:hypothetical protein
MFDCFHICSEEVTINPCQPLYLYIGVPNTLVFAHIRLNGGGVVTIKSKSDASGVIQIEGISEYITKGNIELQVKEPNGLAIPISFGSSCVPFCGIELSVSLSYSDNFPNKKCSTPFNCTWSIPVHNCKFSIEVKNCTWVLKNMKKIVYNGQEFAIEAKPTILVSNIVTVNPAFIAELNAIENSSFSSTLIGGNLTVSYSGTSSVNFIDNACNPITKICS